MTLVLENTPLPNDFYRMRVRQDNNAVMGQFYMVRGWGVFPVLSRPISVHDSDSETLSLLYRVVGEGTELLSELREGDHVTLDGPYGNGFPVLEGRLALVGGGVGIAPLYLASKSLRRSGASVDLYLGFRDAPILEEEYRAVCDRLIVDVGGFITDRLDPSAYDAVLSCGPEPMMRVLHAKCLERRTPLYVSMENRMACGLGACLVCSCKTADGMRRVCKDGPVFESKAVFFDA